MSVTFRGQCDHCGQWAEVEVPDEIAAFAERRVDFGDVLGPCSRCRVGVLACRSRGRPRLARPLLEEWVRDAELHLWPEEEDCELARHSALDDLIWLLEQPDVLNEKRWTIVSGLCYLLLVGLEDLDEGTLPLEERRRQTDEALQIREALRSRRPLLLENYFAEDCREDDEECLGEDLWFVLRFLDDPTGFIM